MIIIGAGLAAARQLQALGFKVFILEGRGRPGGRVLTKKMTGADCQHAVAADRDQWEPVWGAGEAARVSLAYGAG